MRLPVLLLSTGALCGATKVLIPGPLGLGGNTLFTLLLLRASTSTEVRLFSFLESSFSFSSLEVKEPDSVEKGVLDERRRGR